MKCPFINIKGNCRFSSHFGYNCPLLNTQNEVECYDLPVKDYNLIMNYYHSIRGGKS